MRRLRSSSLIRQHARERESSTSWTVSTGSNKSSLTLGGLFVVFRLNSGQAKTSEAFEAVKKAEESPAPHSEGCWLFPGLTLSAAQASGTLSSGGCAQRSCFYSSKGEERLECEPRWRRRCPCDPSADRSGCECAGAFGRSVNGEYRLGSGHGDCSIYEGIWKMVFLGDLEKKGGVPRSTLSRSPGGRGLFLP